MAQQVSPAAADRQQAVVQRHRNDDAGSTARYLIRDRDGKYPALFDAILADSAISVVRSVRRAKTPFLAVTCHFAAVVRLPGGTRSGHRPGHVVAV